jgi:hypothetical protein
LSWGLAGAADASEFCVAGAAAFEAGAAAAPPDPACAHSPPEIKRKAVAAISRVKEKLRSVFVFVMVTAAP